MWTNNPRTYYGWLEFYIMLPLPQIYAQDCSKGWTFQRKVGPRTVGCCAHIDAVLWYLGYQRHQTDEVLSETKYCGTVKVVKAADTDWEYKCRINELLYARRVSDFYTRCHSIYFHNHLLIRDDFYKSHIVDFIHIYQHFDAFMRF